MVKDDFYRKAKKSVAGNIHNIFIYKESFDKGAPSGLKTLQQWIVNRIVKKMYKNTKRKQMGGEAISKNCEGMER